MKIKFLGADETVTGSKHLLIGENSRLLIDCGFYQGPDFLKQNNKLARLIKQEHIDGIVLTHAHLDHSGFLPRLFRDGIKVPVFCTHGTKDLCEIILNDNARIQQKEFKEHNKQNKEIFYSEEDVTHALAYFQCHEFNKAFKFKEFTIKFKRAGHILGASSPIISNANNSVQFSGDIGKFDDFVMREPDLASSEVKNIVMESTYGDKVHPINYAKETLIEILDEAIINNSTILIPAFSVGRSQTIMLLLHQIFLDHPEKKLSVFMDSAMTKKVTELYFKYTDETKMGKVELNEILSYFQSVDFNSQRENLMKNNATKIILTASGMLSGGHIMQYLPIFAVKENTILMLMGYQSEGTIGRQILDGETEFNLNGTPFTLSAKVVNFPYLSSHLDHNGLISWLQHTSAKKIILVHGEKPSLNELKSSLELSRKSQIHIAKLSETLEL